MDEDNRNYDYPELSPEDIQRYLERAKRLQNEAMRAILARMGAGFRTAVSRLGARLGRRDSNAPAKSAGANADAPAPAGGVAALSRRGADSRTLSASSRGERGEMRRKAA